MVLDVLPLHRGALSTRRGALEKLLAHSAGENLSEVMWLRSQIVQTDKDLEDAQ